MSLTYNGFVAVAVIAFAAPLLRELVPALVVPAVVLELLAGVILGPHGLDLVSIDTPTTVFAQIGLAFLLFLAGLEVRLDKIEPRVAKLAGAAFVTSFVIALVASYLLHLTGLVRTPLLVAITFVATSLGIVLVPLKDGRQLGTHYGKLVIATASLAELGSIVLLSFFFSAKRPGFSTELLHIGAFAIFALALYLVLTHGRAGRVWRAIDRLADSTSQLRVRADFALVGVAVLAAVKLGLEAILAAFTLGMIRGLADRDRAINQEKVDAIAFGIFVPFFFITSGLRFDVGALFASPSSAVRLPLFLCVLALVHMVPALFFRRELGARGALAAGLMLSTSLSFVVVATGIGTELDLMSSATSAALVGAGLLSVVLFPAMSMALARGEPAGRAAALAEP
ncbi:MAG TPA: cation:proton antiporter [Thermoleophilaceae bacterium]